MCVDDNLPKIINQVFTYGEHTDIYRSDHGLIFPHLVKKGETEHKGVLRGWDMDDSSFCFKTVWRKVLKKRKHNFVYISEAFGT